MLEKSRNAVFFQWFVCRVSRKVGLLKRRVRRSVLRGEIKNCTPLWRKAHLQVKMYKTPHVWTTFGSSDVEKLHATVAKSTFGSENVKKLTIRDYFWKFRCWKIVRRCGEKPHSEVKMLKNWGSGTTFWSSDVQKLYAAVAKNTFASQNVQNMMCLDHFGTFWCWKIAWRCGETHICKSKCAKHDGFGALFVCSDVEKLHAAVASQNVQNTTGLEHFCLEFQMVEKLHAAVAKGTFGSENVQKL